MKIIIANRSEIDVQLSSEVIYGSIMPDEVSFDADAVRLINLCSEKNDISIEKSIDLLDKTFESMVADNLTESQINTIWLENTGLDLNCLNSFE